MSDKILLQMRVLGLPVLDQITSQTWPSTTREKRGSKYAKSMKEERSVRRGYSAIVRGQSGVERSPGEDDGSHDINRSGEAPWKSAFEPSRSHRPLFVDPCEGSDRNAEAG
jgi:hypothetical protein